MPNAELVYEFEGTQNLNTTPIDITGLQGDTYDYEIIMFKGLEASNGQVRISFNNDLTANYRKYWMEGQVAGAFAFTNNSDSYINTETSSVGNPALLLGNIRGLSGGERFIDCNIVKKGASVTNVVRQSSYWKNTANELTSIQLYGGNSVSIDYHIILYRYPKETAQTNWEKVDELSWSAESPEKSFTGLDGDQDKIYRVIWYGDEGLNIEINDDNGSNYTLQRIRNNSGSLQSLNSTTQTSMISATEESEFIINAESGINRLVMMTGSQTVAEQQSRRAFWWQNTGDNITSLDCTPSASATGTAILYRQNKNCTGALPWVLLDQYSHDGTDFSSGNDFTGLDGDDYKLLKIEVYNANFDSAGELRFQINNNTGAIYDEQRLRSSSSSSTSNYTTRVYGILSEGTDQQKATIYMYPKSGENRPMTLESAYGENTLQNSSIWYKESAAEITSIKIYGSTTAAFNGDIKISALY